METYLAGGPPTGACAFNPQIVTAGQTYLGSSAKKRYSYQPEAKIFPTWNTAKVCFRWFSPVPGLTMT